jgi:pimeloyl-ACP methyl ester carboxylesterase
MDALRIKKTTLCGLSMGGYIALNAIENHPKRFDALVLCDTQCLADSVEAKGKRMKAVEGIWKNGLEMFVDESLKDFFAQESLLSKKNIIADVREMIMNTSEKSIIKTLIALSKRVETCSKLSEIKVPVLILVGKEDKIIPPEAAQFMHEKINGSVMTIIKNAGHVSNLENQDQFNEQLKKFLGEKTEVRIKKSEV